MERYFIFKYFFSLGVFFYLKKKKIPCVCHRHLGVRASATDCSRSRLVCMSRRRDSITSSCSASPTKPSLGPGQGRRTQGEAAAAAKASEPVAHGQLRSPSASARRGPGRAPLEAAALRAGAPTFSPDPAIEWGTEFPLRLCSREFVTKNVSSAASGNPMLRLPLLLPVLFIFSEGTH